MTKTTNRLILILSLIGLLVSAYLSYSKLSGIPVKCSLLTGCETVEQSSYSMIFGIPVAVLGLVFYLSLIISTFFRVNINYKDLISKFVLIATAFGFIFSLYLTYLELYVIFAICAYCVLSALVSTGLFFVSIYENIVDNKFLIKKEEII